MLLGLSCVTSNHAMAQDSAQANLMQASAGEKSGALAKGELLITALKREKVDLSSARQAMKSIEPLFDFRLSRSGDKYIFRVGSGQKLLMLRYQRGIHVYETIWDAASGTYSAHILEAGEQPAAVPEPTIQPQLQDEDGEVDVEHAVMAKEIHTAPSADISSRPDDIPEQTANAELNALDVANPNDPILPEDPALAGKPSPDEEFPLENHEFTGEQILDDDVLNNDDIEQQEDDELLNAPVIPPQAAPLPAPVQAPNQIIPEANTPTEPSPPPVAQTAYKKQAEQDSTTFSTISLVMFITGLVLFLFSFFTAILPLIRSRRRISAMGLHIRNSIDIAPGHRIACVEQDGHLCLIAIHPDTMSFIAPCPVDDEHFWTKLKAKTYWYHMAQKPMSDRQIAAFIDEIHKPQASIAEKIETVPEQDRETCLDDSTAILITSLDDSKDNFNLEEDSIYR